ncbi:universal stress protein [Streptomyces sp. NPDC054841]
MTGIQAVGAVERPLIVGVDGSSPSLDALDWAVDEAVLHGVPLHVVHASRWQWYEGHTPSFGADRSAVQTEAENIAASAAERAQLRSGSCTAPVQWLTKERLTRRRWDHPEDLAARAALAQSRPYR